MYLTGDFVPQKARLTVPKFGDEWVLSNLEGPVCADGLQEAPKAGVHLHSMPFAVEGKWAFSLANNHLMDFGVPGWEQTKDFLAQRDEEVAPTRWAGVGRNIAESRKPMMLTEAGKRIAVFACCEHQFGVADSQCAGVAEKGEWLFDAVARTKKECADIVVVSCHCASEFSPFVSPKLQAYYRRLIDNGVDIVHGHHSHVPQGWEEYRGRPIFYGLGNFVVDSGMWASSQDNRWSLVAHVDLSGEKISWSVKPFGEIPEHVELYLHAVNSGFESPALLEPLWQEACVQIYHRIYEQILRVFPAEDVKLDFRSRARKIAFSFKDVLYALLGRCNAVDKTRRYARAIGNFFSCESHVDVISTALGVLTGGIVDKRTPNAIKIVKEVMP